VIPAAEGLYLVRSPRLVDVAFPALRPAMQALETLAANRP
jgi:hypothetical protein